MIKIESYHKQAVPKEVHTLEPYNEIKYARPQALPKKTSTKKMEGLSVQASINEAVKPNTLVRVVDEYEKVIGERPWVAFSELINMKNETPQIDTIIGFETDMIVGTDLNINADDDEAKELCEEFANTTALYDKIKNHTNTSLTTGYGLLVRVRKAGVITNIEEFDISSLYETYRDEYGNVLEYVQRIDNFATSEFRIKATGDYIPLIFKKNGRSAYGLSEFHAMAIPRTVGNRTTRPLIKALQSLDDVVIGTLENFAYPIEYHTYEGANTEQLEEEARKYRDKKPGDTFFINRMHEIDRREPTQAKFDSFIEHFKTLLQHGTGFPLDMLTGDFSSRASSQTADSFFMRKIRAYQKYLVKLIKAEIFEELLRSLGWDENRIKKANVIVEFEIKSEQAYTPEIVLQRFQGGSWTLDELREFDKGNGQDLFDDEKIKIEQEEKKKQQEEQFQMQKAGMAQKNDQGKKDTEQKLKKIEAHILDIKERGNINEKYAELFAKIDDKAGKVREAIQQENNSLITRRLGVLEKLEEKLENME